MMRLLLLSLLISAHGIAVESHLKFDLWSFDHGQHLSDYANHSLDIVYLARFDLNAQADILWYKNDAQQHQDPRFESSFLLDQIAEFKTLAPHARVVLTLGGWGRTQAFSPVFASQNLRTKLLDQLQGYFDEYQIDGVHLDWRFSTDISHQDEQQDFADGQNLLLFITEFRQRFDQSLINVTVPTTPKKMRIANFEAIAQQSDYLLIPTDSMHGEWNRLVYHRTPIFRGSETAQQSIESVVNSWLSLPIAPEKIVIRTSMATRIWFQTQGLNHSFQQNNQASDVKFSETDLTENQIKWDTSAQASFSYDAQRQQFFSFETKQSLQAKSRFAALNRLGAIMLTDNAYLEDHQLIQALIQQNQQPLWQARLYQAWQDLKQTTSLFTLILMMSVLVLMAVLMVSYFYWRSWRYMQQLTEFRQNWALLRKQVTFCTELIAQAPELLRLPHFAERFAQLQKISASPIMNAPAATAIKHLQPAEHFIGCFSQKYQIQSPALDKQTYINVDLALLWQAAEMLINHLPALSIKQTNNTLMLSASPFTLTQYLQSKIQTGCQQWQMAGGDCVFDEDGLQLLLPLFRLPTVNTQQKSIDLNALNPVIEQLSQSQDIETQLQLLMQCFEHMGFDGAQVSLDQTSVQQFGHIDAPVQWQFAIQHAADWQISLHSPDALSDQQQLFLQTIAAQLHAIQATLQQFTQSPHILLELYEISRHKDKIHYIEASGGYSEVHFVGQLKTKVVTLRLRRILKFFDQHSLIQIHRSILVNPQKITHIEFVGNRKATVQLGKIKLAVSQKFISRLKALNWQDK